MFLAEAARSPPDMNKTPRISAGPMVTSLRISIVLPLTVTCGEPIGNTPDDVVRPVPVIVTGVALVGDAGVAVTVTGKRSAAATTGAQARRIATIVRTQRLHARSSPRLLPCECRF